MFNPILQLLFQLEKHLSNMDDPQIRKYVKTCRSLQIEPKPLQCIKPYSKLKSNHFKAIKRKHG